MLKNNILWKSSYWFSYALLLITISSLYDSLWLGNLVLNLIRIPIVVLTSIFIVDFIINHKAFKAYFKWLVAVTTFLISGFVIRFLFGLLVFPYFFEESYSFEFFNWYRIASQYIVMIGGLGGYASLYYYRNNLQWSKKNWLLNKEKKEAELNFLRSQMHPHFLFNTLNSIYSEALRKSDEAAELILKLSDMLRFILYECNRDQITLNQELELIQNFIDLEKKRYGNRLEVQYQIPGRNISEVRIPPLLLFSFVENAFKHGVSTQKSDSFVKINIELNSESVQLNIVNSNYTSQKDPMDSAKGIGLENIMKQLELIYENNYSLKLENNAEDFRTVLVIPLMK